MTTWHESVEGSPDDAPLDETQAAVAAQAAQFEDQIAADYEKWSKTLQLTNPVPSVFLENYRDAQGADEEAA